ncbi:TlpA family protein disulfide reductase [Pontibacter sp. KCTC 32443]|uniref:TlpA disulfide reductase family protein n=1 Tax=Pontibacter TaxID=323449 RepID=UPI00164EAAC6|nr:MULTISPECIES: TlpA disulfide reductase family protein [Pontibacter]MBC5774610.1 TlpA family protein disulfide reductase [Pontibacter sp. KCTC 32443]
MKRIQLLLLLAAMLLVNYTFGQGKAIITGKITNPLSDEITVITYPNPLIPEEKEITVELTGNTFKLEIPVTETTLAELVHDNEVVPVYLEPGYTLNLSFNGDKFLKTIKFEGKGANENNYLAQYTRRFDEVEDYQVLPDNIKLNEKGFTEFLDYRKKDQLKNLEKYSSKSPVSEKFKVFALSEIEYGYANDKVTYPALRQRVGETRNYVAPSAAFYTFLDQLDVQKGLAISPAYISFLQNYTAHYTKAAGLAETDKLYYKKNYTIAAEKLQGNARLLAQANILKQSIQKGHIGYSEEMLKDYKVSSKQPEVVAYLEKYLKENSKNALGSLAPDFKLKSIDGSEVALSDFKGKLVYLNFWQAGCGLCMIELPHLQALTKQLQNENIVFLNVGLDDDEEKWRKTVTTKQLLGTHLYLKGMDAELVKRYDLKEVPAYFLIDEEGRFLTVKARRPNDREAANDILRHLNQGQASTK